jgi:hypothetical protein
MTICSSTSHIKRTEMRESTYLAIEFLVYFLTYMILSNDLDPFDNTVSEEST